MVIATLAATAGTALVQAMVNDGWEGLRHKVTSLFGRGQPDPKIEKKLAASRAQLAAASPADLGKLQADLAAEWRTRFGDLLDDHPDVAPDLTALVEELKPIVASASDHSIAVGGDLEIKADHSGIAAGIIHGNVTPSPPTPAAPSPGPHLPDPQVPGSAGS